MIGISRVDGDARRHFGVYPALVTDIVDPDSLGRIQVRFPWLGSNGGGQDVRAWATLCTPYADDNEGILAATALVHNLTLVTSKPSKYRGGRVKVLGPPGLEFDGTDGADWREATHSGAAWFRNLLIR